MTDKIFWGDPYQTECKATVTQIDDRKIRVDRTIFFAFCGGQESDEGTIDGIRVLEAQKIGDKETIIDIEYTLEKEPPFQVGETVLILINQERRLKLMRLHSATHLVYYFATAELGKMKIIGSHIAAEKARIDFEYEQSIQELLPVIEESLNSFLNEIHPIKREQDAKHSDLRWWICTDWKMPCGGTHPQNTGEIGNISLKRKNIGKGKERIEIYLKA